jgi:hypothetical protein
MDTTGKKYPVAYSLDSIIDWHDSALDLRGKMIDSFPLAKMPVLAKFRLLLLDGDSLHHLPAGTEKLTELRMLYITGAYLKELPPAIGQLTNLQTLHLSGCHLKQLPPETGLLKNLQVLNLENNLLVNLPEQLAGLKKLKMLFLAGNNFPGAVIEKIKKLLPACKIYSGRQY